jgi:hypothetical protein
MSCWSADAMPEREKRIPGLSEEDNRAFFRQRRARNWAILLLLVGVVALFYAISIARLTRV